MNAKVAKKARQLYSRDAHNNALAQANYLRGVLLPCPKNRLVFKLWRLVGRLYFTPQHLDAVTQSYERITKQPAAKP